jgi:hypothetical protein
MSHAQFRRDAIRHHSEKIGRMLGHAHGGAVHSDKLEDEKMIRKAFKEHDEQLHEGKKTKLTFKNGGKVDADGDYDGDEPRRSERRDRRARGGATGGKHKGTHVAVIVAPQGGGGGGGMGDRPPMPVPGPMAPAPHPMPMPPPAPPPGGMAGGAPGAAGMPPIGAVAPRPPMPGMPPGAPMPMRARGGAAGEAVPEKGREPEWAAEESDRIGAGKYKLNKMVKADMRAKGGRVAGKVRNFEDKAPSDGGVDIDDGAGGGLGRLEKIKAYGKNADLGENAMKRGGRA